jgi:hypothetical protein
MLCPRINKNKACIRIADNQKRQFNVIGTEVGLESHTKKTHKGA